jgi:hypothetical protein
MQPEFTIISKHSNQIITIYRGGTIGIFRCRYCNIQSNNIHTLYSHDGFKYIFAGYHITGNLKSRSNFCDCCIKNLRENHDSWLFRYKLGLL